MKSWKEGPDVEKFGVAGNLESQYDRNLEQ